MTDANATCAECGLETHRRNLQTIPVHVTNPDGGYERVPMPVCGMCRGRIRGYDCPHCGMTYSDRDDARHCCERAPGEAPDCPVCDRRMKRTAHGATATGRPTCEFAECEACDIQWGRFTGWHGSKE